MSRQTTTFRKKNGKAYPITPSGGSTSTPKLPELSKAELVPKEASPDEPQKTESPITQNARVIKKNARKNARLASDIITSNSKPA